MPEDVLPTDTAPVPPPEPAPEAQAPPAPAAEQQPPAEPPAAPPAAEEAPDEEAPEQPAEPPAAEAKPSNKRWYVVKVQSGREESIKEAIERRVRKEGLEEFYGQIVIPVEKYTEVKTDKNGRRVTRTKERKLYPGYLMVEVEYNDRILYLFRETSGVGDFVGGSASRPPPPMSDREVQKMLGKPQEGAPGAAPPRPKGLDVGDRVRVTDGTFNGMEGEIKEIQEVVGKARVELTIFGRPVPVDLEYYQIEPA
jgi:transcription termination/antitermination protein NusG